MSRSSAPVVEMRGIHKIYPDGTVALRGVDLKLYKGEVLGLLGENGAGKTTLMKILSGFIKPTAGEIYVNGERVKFRTPADALAKGIAMVHQIFTLVLPLTALENIILGKEVLKPEAFSTLKPLKLEDARKKVEELMKATGFKIPLDTPVELLPLGARQKIEILKALYKGANILILDEPTTFLTLLEVNELFRFIRKFKESGGTVVFISHKIREVLEITDRIVVLRHGKVVGELPTSEATPEKLAVMMVGKEIKLDVILRGKGARKTEGPVLKVEDLWVESDLGYDAVKGVSFEVYPGEIFGIAGVEGNGQDELVQAITGLRPAKRGKIILNGEDVTNSTPIDLYKRGISHIPGDRERFGLVLEFSVTENGVISRQWEPIFTKGFRLDWGSVKRYVSWLVKRFNVVTSSLDAPAKSLSGGNRQRLLVGRELSKKPSLIVAVHPTKGLDIASTMYVRELLAKARDEGKAILLVSADLDEILQLSDRIAVMYEGQFMGIMKAEEATLEKIGLMMGGVRPEEAKEVKVAFKETRVEI